MKVLLTVLFIGILGVYAQEPAYTPMKSNYKFKGIRVDSLFLIPSFADTFAANATKLDSIAGAMIRCGNDFYMRNTSMDGWLQNVNIGAGASPIVNFVNNVFKKSGTDSVYYVIAPADTFFAYKDVGYGLQNVTLDGNTTNQGIIVNDNSLTINNSTSSGQILLTDNNDDNHNNPGIYINDINDSKTLFSINSNIDYDRADLQTSGNVSAEERIQAGNFLSGRTSFNNGDSLYFDYLNSYGDSLIFTRDRLILPYSQYYDTINVLPIHIRNRPKTTYYFPATNGPNYKDTLATLRDTRSVNGSSQNFANTDLTATGDRYHDFTGKVLQITDAQSMAFTSSSFGRTNTLDLGDGVAGLYGNNSSGQYWGLNFSPDYNYTYLRNKSNNAYLSRKNFGTDTIAMLSNVNLLETDYAEPNLNSIDYNITRPPSLLVCNNGNTKTINFPDPDNNKGRRITIWNYTGGNITIVCPTDIIKDKANSTVTTLSDETIYEFIGIAGKWLKISN